MSQPDNLSIRNNNRSEIKHIKYPPKIIQNGNKISLVTYLNILNIVYFLKISKRTWVQVPRLLCVHENDHNVADCSHDH